jgi:hypothetical protein
LSPPELAVKVGLPNAKRNRRGPFDDRLANEGGAPWLQIPMKSASCSDAMSAMHSDFKPAMIPI